MKKTFCYLLSFLSLMSCKNTDKTEAITDSMTDDDMIVYLNEHRADFDSLRTWIYEDKKIQFMLPYSPDDRYLNSITQERADAYFEIMNKLSIQSLSRGNGYRNAIIFYFRDTKENNKTISRGYVYKIDPDKDKEEFITFRPNGENENAIYIKTDTDIVTKAKKMDLGTFVYKPIDKHWSLICIIQ